jgi:hypothetical protein
VTSDYYNDTDDSDLGWFDPTLETEAWNKYGPFDIGWRTAVYPAGTLLATAVTAETTKQAAIGHKLQPATVRLEPGYLLPTQAFMHVPQNVVALYGSLVFTYRVLFSITTTRFTWWTVRHL